MNPARSDPIVTRFLLWGAACALALAIAAVAWAAAFSPDFPLVTGSEPGAWIAPNDTVATNAVASFPDRPRVVSFVHNLSFDASGSPIDLEIQALRHFELRVNGEAVASSETPGVTSNWKSGHRVEALPLRPGPNRIEIDVSNPSGPPLLRLASLGDEPGWVSDETWTVEERGRPARPARLADDRRRPGSTLTSTHTWNLLVAHRYTLLGFAVVGGLLSLALGRRNLALAASRGPLLVGVCIAAFWLFLFIAKIQQLPLHAGFDGPDHLEYIRFVGDRMALPLATDGPAMYHPPLFYVVAAGLRHAGGEEPGTLVRLVPFLSGLFQVAIAFAFARRLFPRNNAVAALAIGVAGLLPVNVYMSAYLSNEPLHAAISAAVLFLTVDLLLVPGWPLGRLAWLGAALGLALLTKVTSLLLLPLVGVFLGAKACFVSEPRTASGTVIQRIVAVGVPAALLAGGFYLRNWIVLGRPVVGNWDVPGSAVQWWQYPGFHTWGYFMDFGESLRRPFFAGYHSLADGLYATLWTDSLLGGVSAIAYRHPYWNYEWMAILPWLAFPATCILVLGLAWFGWHALRDVATPHRLALAFLLSAVVVYFFAVFFINLRLPFYAQAKSSYALAITAPLALAGARGLLFAHQRLGQPGLRWAQVLFHAWAAAFVAGLVLAFGG